VGATRERWFALGLVGASALGLALRIWHLRGLGGFDWDEAATAFIARRPLGDLLAYLRAAPFEHPPLYYVLAHGWLALGRDPAAADEATLRLLSVLLGAAAVPLLGLVGARLMGPGAGLAAAWLLALAPAHLFYSRDARMYPLLVLLCLAGTLALLQALQTGRARWWGAWALAGLAAMATHYFALFPLVGQAAYLAWARRRHGGIRLALAGLAVGAGALVAWGALAPGLRHSLGALRLAPLPPAEARATLGTAFSWLLRGPLWEDPTPTDDLAGALAAGALAVAAAGLAWRRPRGTAGLVALGALPAVLICALVLLGREVPARFLLPALPFGLLALAAGWHALVPRAGGALAVALGLTAAGAWLPAYYAQYVRGDYEGAVRLVEAHARPGEAIVFNGPWQTLLYDHYRRQPAPAHILTGAVPLVPAQVAGALADLARTYRGLWLFEADLGRADPDGYVARWLGRHAYRGESWRFRQVVVTHYLLGEPPALRYPIERAAPGAELLEVAIDPTGLRPGGTSRLSLTWRAAADFSPGLKVSVRLYAGDGGYWWSADPWLTEGWLEERPPRAGDILYTRLAASLPGFALDGPYYLQVLLYRSTERPESGEGWIAWTAPPVWVAIGGTAPGSLAGGRGAEEP
jgi:4-amino-4-deoxy-L-arabinose transferase-like glycosyltransferase